jgi:hypothetical protein
VRCGNALARQASVALRAWRIPIAGNRPSSVISSAHFSRAGGRWTSSCGRMTIRLTRSAKGGDTRSSTGEGGGPHRQSSASGRRRPHRAPFSAGLCASAHTAPCRGMETPLAGVAYSRACPLPQRRFTQQCRTRASCSFIVAFFAIWQPMQHRQNRPNLWISRKLFEYRATSSQLLQQYRPDSDLRLCPLSRRS